MVYNISLCFQIFTITLSFRGKYISLFYFSLEKHLTFIIYFHLAHVAQLVEQRIRNAQVISSSLIVGSIQLAPGSLQAKKWWPETESDRRHKDFQSSALPTELSGHKKNYARKNVITQELCCQGILKLINNIAYRIMRVVLSKFLAFNLDKKRSIIDKRRNVQW